MRYKQVRRTWNFYKVFTYNTRVLSRAVPSVILVASQNQRCPLR
jgi:hypothetical protein